MKLLLLALAFTASAFAANPVNKVPTSALEYEVNRGFGAIGYKYSLGTVVRQAHNTAVGVYDFSVTGGATGDHEVGITLPNKAVVRNVFFDTVTAPLSGGSATVGFKVQSAADLEPLTAIASWTGRTQGTPDGAVGNMIKLTAQRKVYATISVAALTAGKIKVFVDYVVSE